VIAAADGFESWIEQCTVNGIDPAPIVKDALDG